MISFSTSVNVTPANIHLQISELYSHNAMSDSKVRKWIIAFKVGWGNVHDESGQQKISRHHPRFAYCQARTKYP